MSVDEEKCTFNIHVSAIDIVLVLLHQYPQIKTWLEDMEYYDIVTTSEKHAIQFLQSLMESQIQFIPLLVSIAQNITTQLQTFIHLNEQNIDKIIPKETSELIVFGFLRFNIKNNLIPTDLIILCLAFYHDIIPECAHLCDCDDENIKLHAIRQLYQATTHPTNILAIIETGIVPTLIELLDLEGDAKICYQSMITLAKISEDPRFLNYLLNCDILSDLLYIFPFCANKLNEEIEDYTQFIQLQRATCDVLKHFGNITHAYDAACLFEMSYAIQILETLNNMLLSINNKETVTNMIEVIVALTKTHFKSCVVDKMFELKMVNKLINSLKTGEITLGFTVCEGLLCIMTRSPEYVNKVMDLGLISILHKMIENKGVNLISSQMIIYICGFSNNNQDYIQSFIDKNIKLNVTNTDDFKITQQLILMTHNVLKFSSCQQVKYLIDLGVTTALFSWLQRAMKVSHCSETDLIEGYLLVSIGFIFNHSNISVDEYIKLIENCDGWKILQLLSLQLEQILCSSVVIRDQTNYILNIYNKEQYMLESGVWSSIISECCLKNIKMLPQRIQCSRCRKWRIVNIPWNVIVSWEQFTNWACGS
eukprot:206470_1